VRTAQTLLSPTSAPAGDCVNTFAPARVAAAASPRASPSGLIRPALRFIRPPYQCSLPNSLAIASRSSGSTGAAAPLPHARLGERHPARPVRGLEPAILHYLSLDFVRANQVEHERRAVADQPHERLTLVAEAARDLFGILGDKVGIT